MKTSGPELCISKLWLCENMSVYVCVCSWLSFEGPTGSIGCSISCSIGSCSLNGLVRHNPSCKLLLSLLKTSPSGTIQCMNLERTEKGNWVRLSDLNVPHGRWLSIAWVGFTCFTLCYNNMNIWFNITHNILLCLLHAEHLLICWERSETGVLIYS